MEESKANGKMWKNNVTNFLSENNGIRGTLNNPHEMGRGSTMCYYRMYCLEYEELINLIYRKFQWNPKLKSSLTVTFKWYYQCVQAQWMWHLETTRSVQLSFKVCQ